MCKESVIIERIGYDKEGHTVYTKLGNGTETRYTYDNERQRLQEMTLTSGDNSLMHNRYTYDAVDNILGISNAVDPQELFDCKPSIGKARTVFDAYQGGRERLSTQNTEYYGWTYPCIPSHQNTRKHTVWRTHRDR